MFINKRDPCPCQSGQSYKDCCQHFGLDTNAWFQIASKTVIEALFAETKSLDALGRMLDMLARHAPDFIETQGLRFFGDAVLKIFRTSSKLVRERTGEILQSLILCYFELEEGPDGPESMIAAKLNDPSMPFTQPERLFLANLDRTHYSFYTLVEQRSAYELVLRDILLEKTYVIFDTQLPKQITKGILFYTKVLPYKDIRIVFGLFPVSLSIQDHIGLLDFKKELKQEGLLTQEALSSVANERVRKKYLSLAFLKEPGKFYNTDREEFDCHEIVYKLRLDSPEDLAALLPLTLEDDINDALRDIKADEEGNMAQFNIVWCKKGNALHPTWETTQLGHLFFEDDICRIAVNSKERADLIQILMSQYLGDKVRLVSVTRMTELNDQMKNKQLPEDICMDMTMVKQKKGKPIYDNTYWLDTPIPALDNCTPRQASKNPELREKLDLLICMYETSPKKEHSVEFELDWGSVRHTLNLSA